MKEQIQGFRLCLIEDSLSQRSPGAGLWLILLCENLGQVWFGCSYSVARQWEQFVKHKTQTCASKTEEIITISAREHDITLLLSIWESTTLTGVQSTFTAGLNNRAVRTKTLCAGTGIRHRWRKACGRQPHRWERRCWTVLYHFLLENSHKNTHSLDSSTFVSATFSPSSDINQQARFPETENPLSKRKASNTCVSEERARTRVKLQATRPRHRLVTHGRWSLAISVSVLYLGSSAAINNYEHHRVESSTWLGRISAQTQKQ